MRQAGRFLPQYRALRAKHDLLELCHEPELAAQVTLLPVERLKVDAAIIFADILLPFEPLGLGLSFTAGEGPHIAHPIRDAARVAALPRADPERELSYVLEAVRLAARALPPGVPLIGGAGVPVIHFGTDTATFLEDFAAAGGDVIGVDWRIPLDEAWRRIGARAIQGNLDPAALLAPSAALAERVRDVLARAGRRPGHIFNLGHGVLPETPVEAAQTVVELVHGC